MPIASQCVCGKKLHVADGTAAGRIKCPACGEALASGGADGTVKLWDTETGQELASFQAPGRSIAVAFSPDGKLLAVPGGKKIVLWDVETRAERASLTLALKGNEPDWDVDAVGFAPDGKTVADGGGNWISSVSGRGLALWDVPASGEKVQKWHETGPAATCLAFSPDGKWLAAGGGRLSRKLEKPDYPVPCLALSPNGKRLAWTSGDLGKAGQAGTINLRWMP